MLRFCRNSCYAAIIEVIAGRIEDAHRLNNNLQVDNTFNQNLQKLNVLFTACALSQKFE